MLNGFGERKAIEALMAELGAQYQVEVDYSAADMSRPGHVTEMVELCVARFGGIDILVNNAGIQHTAPVEEFPTEKSGADPCHQSLLCVSTAIKAALPHMRRRLGPDHQHRFGPWTRRIGDQSGVCRGQFTARRPDQGRRARDGAFADHVQRHLPGCGPDATGAEPD